MSHLSDSVSERNFDVNRPSSAQQSTSQPFRSKSSVNNRAQDHPTPPKQTAKKSPKHTAMSRHKPPQSETGNSAQTHTNLSGGNIATACQNININKDNDEVDQGDSPRKKNAKKKERLKQLQMPPQGDPVNIPQPSQQSPGYLGREEYTSLHEFFAKHVSPMYAHSNSRYLENLSHHPQFQLAQNIQMGRDYFGGKLPTSVPNTPQGRDCFGAQLPSSVPTTPQGRDCFGSQIASSVPNTPQGRDCFGAQLPSSVPTTPQGRDSFGPQLPTTVPNTPHGRDAFGAQLPSSIPNTQQGRDYFGAQIPSNIPNTPQAKDSFGAKLLASVSNTSEARDYFGAHSSPSVPSTPQGRDSFGPQLPTSIPNTQQMKDSFGAKLLASVSNTSQGRDYLVAQSPPSMSNTPQGRDCFGAQLPSSVPNTQQVKDSFGAKLLASVSNTPQGRDYFVAQSPPSAPQGRDRFGAQLPTSVPNTPQGQDSFGANLLASVSNSSQGRDYFVAQSPPGVPSTPQGRDFFGAQLPLSVQNTQQVKDSFGANLLANVSNTSQGRDNFVAQSPPSVPSTPQGRDSFGVQPSIVSNNPQVKGNLGAKFPSSASNTPQGRDSVVAHLSSKTPPKSFGAKLQSSVSNTSQGRDSVSAQLLSNVSNISLGRDSFGAKLQSTASNIPQGRDNFGGKLQSNVSNTPQGRDGIAAKFSGSLLNTPHGRDYFNTQLPASAPNTPLVLPQRSTSMSIPNSPLGQPDYMNPQCLQNVMQHPLLSQTYNAHIQLKQMQVHQPQVPAPVPAETTSAQPSDPNTTPKHKKNKKKSKANGIPKFDDYLSPEEVEAGLKTNELLEGVIRINPKQFQHSYVSNADRSEQDILIDGIKNRNRALEGDIVVVQYIESDNEEPNTEENKQKRGKVVFIKEKVHNRTCIGNLKPMPDNNRQKALLVPRDHRMPRLNIPFTCWPNHFYENHKSYENTLFLAKIVDWADTRFALGKIMYNVGQSGDMVAETNAILAQTGLDVKPFGPEVRHLYPRLDYTIPDEEIATREDCRKLCLFSIDPATCRDIDDAVTCKELENGNFEVGVHIADVSHFLTENTILDKIVSEKATTIYLVEKAYHMLPEELCMLCSLFPGVDKLAFSVFWEITKDAEVLSHRFAKTVINSCAQLSYTHTQLILDDDKDAETSFPETYNGFVYNDIHKTIKNLGSLSALFRKKRFEGGALRIDQPKLSFHLNPSGLPESFKIYESQESHQLIEEFMLLANMTVAKRIYDDYPRLAFLRCHPPPSMFMLKQLAKALHPMGIELDINTAGTIHTSLTTYVGPNSTDRGKVMVLNMLCAKPMARAKYFCADRCHDEDFHHYALNVPLYTHFTSPIRRYADIMVHRLLAASLKYRETPKWEPDYVRSIAAQCNKMKYNAKKAGELSTELYTMKYIEMNSPLQTDAAVVEVREKYIDVIIIAMGMNRRIFFNTDFPGKYKCIKNEDSAKLSIMELTWNATDQHPEVMQVIEVFSTIQVELYKDEDVAKMDVKLVRPSESDR